MSEISLGTLYDFNKQAMAQLPPLDLIEYNKKTKELVSYICNHESPYWMFLCNERRDYTLFIPVTEIGTLAEFKECLNNRGDVISIDKQADGNYEVWIRDFKTKENFAYYMFDYRNGVIEA